MFLDLFSNRRPEPENRRVTVAIYPDGHECRIERAPKMGPGLWLYDRDCAAGPGKANAIQQAIDSGARTEERMVPNPSFRRQR